MDEQCKPPQKLGTFHPSRAVATALHEVYFFSLQMGPTAADLANIKANITDLAPATEDMAYAAAQMAHLDLILTGGT